jgi:hypothetical protein
MYSKKNRFESFIGRLEKHKSASTAQEAFDLLSHILNQVEDELTNIACSPERWMNDGRMYPPQADSKRSTSSIQVCRYRSKGHNTYIGNNGAIKIQGIGSNKTVFIDKAGQDSKKVNDL